MPLRGSRMSLKSWRITSTSIIAGAPVSFSTSGPGKSSRYIWWSPFACRSTLTESFKGASAGTALMKRRPASSSWALVSPWLTSDLDLVLFDQLAADDHALDLAGALADQQQGGVA